MNSEPMNDRSLNDELWSRVEAALDARADPLSDPTIANALPGDPRARRTVTQLVDRLERLSKNYAPERPRRKRVSSLLLAVAAVLVLLASVAGNHWLRSGRRAPNLSTARTIDTITLTIEHTSPPPAKGARVDFDSPPVILWTLEGAPR